MSLNFSIFGGGGLERVTRDGRTEIVQLQRVLRHILSFTGRTIDDVINDPIARNEVRSYYKLHCWMSREMEIGELERQWEVPRISRGTSRRRM
jgi:hypothetical protein